MVSLVHAVWLAPTSRVGLYRVNMVSPPIFQQSFPHLQIYHLQIYHLQIYHLQIYHLQIYHLQIYGRHALYVPLPILQISDA